MVEQAVDDIAALLAKGPTPEALADIQGIVYRAYGKHAFTGYVLARLDGTVARSKAWLRALAPLITTAAERAHCRDVHTMVALSPDGLRKLGVAEATGEALDGLPQEAKLGMASRQRVLRDDAPDKWTVGADSDLHVLVIVYATSAAAREAAITAREGELRGAGAHVFARELSSEFTGHEPFGFADGLAQPFVPGHAHEHRPGQQVIAAGEVVLGYHNAYDKLPASPEWPAGADLGKNGSYLVFRKLRQDIGALDTWIDDHARRVATDDPADIARWSALLRAKVMGRWPSGASLAQTWTADDPAFAAPDVLDHFGYLDGDADGQRCPIASHVRRANPRDARGGDAEDSLSVTSRHRIVRRGRAYADDAGNKGLYFVCLQANIARGFEFIQQTWLGNHGFHGVYQEVDPIMGNADSATGSITLPASPFRYRLTDVPDVVHVLGGGYFFLPSLTAIARIARVS